MAPNSKITKAIICCGGKATRFAPISRTVPKEMLPIVDRPVIHYITEELIGAGITDLLLLIGTDRGALQHYMDAFGEQINIYYRRVPVARGTADNIWHARSFIGKDNFIVAYCDDVFFDGNPSAELISDFEKYESPVITVYKIQKEDAFKYGIFDGKKIIEKPREYIGSLAAVGRYLLSPEIFAFIDEEMNGKRHEGEICFVKQLNKIKNLRAIATKAKRFDTGIPSGLFAANKFAFGKK
jgi:UTP--glucose-1-phosphate uridylyltransferase